MTVTRTSSVPNERDANERDAARQSAHGTMQTANLRHPFFPGPLPTRVQGPHLMRPCDPAMAQMVPQSDMERHLLRLDVGSNWYLSSKTLRDTCRPTSEPSRTTMRAQTSASSDVPLWERWGAWRA